MAYKLITIILCLSFANLLGQENPQIPFTGKLLMDDFSSISYRINISLGKYGDVEGLSTKDIFIESPKSYSVTGFLDIQNSKISFVETAPISKISTFESDNECFIYVSNADLKLIDPKIVIEGTFISKTSNGETCYTGKIKLAGPLSPLLKNKFLQKEMAYFEEQKFTDSDSLLLNTTPSVTLTKNSIEKIKLSKTTEKIALELWDEEVEDGDIIDIYLNNELFKEDFRIKKDSQRLIISLLDEELEIKIKAKNTGRIFPNTVSIRVIGKENVYKLETKLRRNESASILFQRKN